MSVRVALGGFTGCTDEVLYVLWVVPPAIQSAGMRDTQDARSHGRDVELEWEIGHAEGRADSLTGENER